MAHVHPINYIKRVTTPRKGIGWRIWRVQGLKSTLWCTLIFGGIAYWGSLLLSKVSIDKNVLALMVVANLSLLFITIIPRLPYTLRAAILLGLLLLSGSVLLFSTPFTVIATIFLFSYVFLSGLLIGWQAMAAGVILCIGILSAAAYGTLLIPIDLVYKAEILNSAILFIYAGIALASIMIAAVPLAFYIVGSSRVFDREMMLIQEVDRQKSQYQQSLGQITNEFDAQLQRDKSIAGMISLLGSSVNEEQLLKRTLALIVDRFGYQMTEIHFFTELDDITHAIQIINQAGLAEQTIETIPADQIPDWIVSIIEQAHTLTDTDTHLSAAAFSDSAIGSLDTSAAFIPIKVGKQMLGVLTVFKPAHSSYREREILALRSIAHLLGFGLNHHRLTMAGQIQPGNISSVNQAIHLITQANTPEQILHIVVNTLRKSTFPVLHFSAEKDNLNLVSVYDHDELSLGVCGEMSVPLEPVEKSIAETRYLPFRLAEHPNLPGELTALFLKLGCTSAAYIPVQQNERLHTLFIIGSPQSSTLTALTIQPYASLAAYATTALEKVIATRHLHHRVAALQSLAKFSQAISVVSELDELFDSVHEQINQVIGEVDLAIAQYDPSTKLISIPYAHEAGEMLSLEPLPLGEGLTSILIRSYQPLMIVEDTERKALELGAKITGVPAKSWLGVPLIVAGEILGAIILQDTVREQRFDDDDLRLMTTLASQVAITMRNIRLLQDTKYQAEKEMIISNITTKIWAAPDIESVTRTALHELGRALNAGSGMIRLGNHNDKNPVSNSSEQGTIAKP